MRREKLHGKTIYLLISRCVSFALNPARASRLRARDHHRTMMPASAAEPDVQTALAFANLVRDQINGQLGDAIDRYPAALRAGPRSC
jgi:hypothetical protein